MPLLLIVLFIVVPIAELYVIIQVGQLIGVWPTLVLLLADALLGSLLLETPGARRLAALQRGAGGAALPRHARWPTGR